MNGLPCPSTALGRFSTEACPADPGPTHWRAPVLHVLAEKAHYRPRIFIPMGEDHALWREVFKASCYALSDLDGLPRILDKKRGTERGSKSRNRSKFTAAQWTKAGSKMGFLEQIYYAARDLRDDHKKPAYSIPLVLIKDGAWALTEAGVAVATTLRAAFGERQTMVNKQGEQVEVLARNVTNIWLDGQIRFHDLYNRLIKAITFDRTTCKERESGEVYDHVDHFLTSRIRNDSFATRLGSCDPPTFREIKTYTLRATYTTFKRRAQDPLFREGRGALTYAERRAGGPTSASMVASEFARVLQTTECLRSESNVVSEVLVDHGQTARDMHRLDFDRGIDKVREAFRRFKPGNHDRMFRVFTLMAEGHTVEEIGYLSNTTAERVAELLDQKMTFEQIGKIENGVSRNRAATLMADTRGALREARQASQDAVKVLAYIAEEPCSTQDDIAEDLELTSDLKMLLGVLVENGRLQATTFNHAHKGSVVTYTVTQSGDTFITNRATYNPVSDGILDSFCL